jgi:hypothetical protein
MDALPRANRRAPRWSRSIPQQGGPEKGRIPRLGDWGAVPACSLWLSNRRASFSRASLGTIERLEYRLLQFREVLLEEQLRGEFPARADLYLLEDRLDMVANGVLGKK